MNRPEFVTAGSTVAACDAIATYLRPKLSGDKVAQVQAIERHVGRFNEPAEIKRYLTGSDGAIRIAALRVSDIKQFAGGVQGKIEFAAYVMATDKFGYARDTRAEVICGLLTRELCRRGVGKDMGAESSPEAIRADNLYSGQLDGLGVCIWVVTWSQLWRTDDEIDLTTIDDFLILGLNAPLADGSPSLDAEIHVRGDTDGN